MTTAIVNAGNGSCFFEDHAQRLARAMNLEITDTPAEYNYLLGWDSSEKPSGQCFIPYEAILVASDKRRLAQVFAQHNVATPQTYLLHSQKEVQTLVQTENQCQWVLKWPTGCGGAGHYLLESEAAIPLDWPRPYVVQKFIQLEIPEVYRLYCVAEETFGWNVRRFPRDVNASPFVAHARGARYEAVGQVPPEAEIQARRALLATGLFTSFGCADLLRDEQGKWLVLEANTDGIFSHVDRDISIGNIAEEIENRLAGAFWRWARS